MPHLRNGRQVLLSGFGHTTDFWNVQVGAGNHLINHYLDTGKVDASRYVPQKVDFTPALKQGTLARELVGALAGLALVTLLSLVWMAIRIRTRGHLGRRARVVVRSVWALVLGLGGWFAAALFVLIALPSVPIDATARARPRHGRAGGAGRLLGLARSEPGRHRARPASRRPSAAR